MEKELTFELLEEKVRQFAPEIPLVRKIWASRVALLVGLLGALTALLAVQFADGAWRTGLVLSGLTVELVGFGAYLVVEIHFEFHWFRNAKSRFARTMESDYSEYQALLRWLREFPLAEVRRRRSFLRHRQDTMARRFGLVVGGMDRLGILPVAVAVYLQYRTLSSPADISLWHWFVIAFLIGTYLLCHWLADLKLRLDFYVGLFDSALAED